jgi:hypothetical protein
VIRDCFECAFGSGIFDQKDVSRNRRLSVTKQLERLSGYPEYNKNSSSFAIDAFRPSCDFLLVCLLEAVNSVEADARRSGRLWHFKN